jgi:hypothetical protein
LSEQEQESENGRDWKDDAAFHGIMETGGCCLLSLFHAIALLLIPVSALLILNR